MTSRVASCEILTTRGRGAERAAAYGARETVELAREAVFYTPRHGEDWVTGRLLLPPYAAPRFADPRTLWAAVEARAGRRPTHALGLMLTLPREGALTLAERLDLVEAFAGMFLADRLPVQVDLHRVAGPDGVHWHAHLVVGLLPLDRNRVLADLQRQWLPVVRRGHTQALDWSRIWSATQAAFYATRNLPLAVAPASGMPEPKRCGRRASATPRQSGAPVGEKPLEPDLVTEARHARAGYLSVPENLIAAVTADDALVSLAEVDALLESVYADLAEREIVRGDVLAHPSLVTVHRSDDEVLYTTHHVIAQWRSALTQLAALPGATCRVSHASLGLVHRLQDCLSGTNGDRPVLVWADAWIRARAGAAVPPGTRQIRASDLPRVAAGETRSSPATRLIAVSVERFTDAQLLALAQYASRDGIHLDLLVDLSGPYPVRSHGLWRLVLAAAGVEALPGVPEANALARLIQASTAIASVPRPPGMNTPVDARFDDSRADPASTTTGEGGAAPEPVDAAGGRDDHTAASRPAPPLRGHALRTVRGIVPAVLSDKALLERLAELLGRQQRGITAMSRLLGVTLHRAQAERDGQADPGIAAAADDVAARGSEDPAQNAGSNSDVTESERDDERGSDRGNDVGADVTGGPADGAGEEAGAAGAHPRRFGGGAQLGHERRERHTGDPRHSGDDRRERDRFDPDPHHRDAGATKYNPARDRSSPGTDRAQPRGPGRAGRLGLELLRLSTQLRADPSLHALKLRLAAIAAVERKHLREDRIARLQSLIAQLATRRESLFPPQAPVDHARDELAAREADLRGVALDGSGAAAARREAALMRREAARERYERASASYAEAFEAGAETRQPLLTRIDRRRARLERWIIELHDAASPDTWKEPTATGENASLTAEPGEGGPPGFRVR